MSKTKFKSMEIYNMMSRRFCLVLDTPFTADLSLEENCVYAQSRGLKIIKFQYPRLHLVIGCKEFVFEEITVCRSHRKKRINKKHGNKFIAWTIDGFMIKGYK